MAHKEMRKSRVLLTAAGLFLGLGCLWVRVAVLQTALHGHFAARARENQEHHEKILPRRGLITDRHGKVMAHDLGVSEVAVYPPQLSDPDYKDRKVVREADLRRHLLAQAKVEDKLLEADDTPDPRFSAKPEDLQKKGIKDFQLYYALNTLKRLAAPTAVASAAPAKKSR